MRVFERLAARRRFAEDERLQLIGRSFAAR
jgi:hypothetical protein